ncbi:putative non-ribosomal peptide synthetase [Streptomyces avermitilis MA-4680 = NBRC 14893]|uniref:Non-ribosomal peptide synthetase n=2 Tax=Streptomyces avermitilis TaxID=33903 RepID=Q79Z94_STRAW|nr:non-ribosomal peptide synthetase [Streptomyces avermitilis]MYS98794.1 non-ribosomal peptide synthetase [Streptomyces sp. SID5469]BAB69321.1 non-ribosomal peptide synthetase [Streptomyces avermitilis]BAC70909.1 putative non-ribosomal peptide synthetase [Streptomyces avermitilis MA-4680 = NBRC 14893]
MSAPVDTPVPGGEPMAWLPTPADPAASGAYAPEEPAEKMAGAEPGAVSVLATRTTPARVLAAWAALLHHHTGRVDLDFGFADAAARPATVRLRVEPTASLGALEEAAARALRSPSPGEPAAATPWMVRHTDAGPSGPGRAGALVAELDESAGGGCLRLRHDPAAHRADAVARHAVHLRGALTALADDPTLPVRELDPLTPAERTRLLVDFNRTTVPYPRDSRVEELFAERARTAPGHPAVVHGDTVLSYAELDHRSELLAARLRAEGLPPGEPVALLLRREPTLVVAALAVLKAGGVYLPVDPDYPADRVAYLLADSGARRVLTVSDLAGQLKAVHDRSADDLTVLALDTWDWRRTPGTPPCAPDAPPRDAGDAAYLMYTSGTTGKPKGVLVPHRGITRLVSGIGYVRLDPTTRMAQVGTTGFDASVWEMWGALLGGGTLCILDRETLLDTEELGRALREQRITTALFTSALFSRLADEDVTLFRPLRDLLVGGDVLSARHAREVLAANPGLRLVNAYGPTENAVISTCQIVGEPVGARVPIGRPVPNATAYVLNQDGLPLPTGVPGELHVGGDGLAVGYHGRPDLTERAFVPHPFAPGQKLYRTGDRVRLLPDGAVDFVGRTDHQVKVRGFRVEPGEIETTLSALPGVRAAVVLARRLPGSSDSYLCGYVVGDPDLDTDRLRSAAAESLPPHMVPAHLIVLPALPLTVNGKVDRAALPEPAVATGTAPGGRPPRDELERALIDLWEDTLGIAGLGVDDLLSAYGAGSLTATRLSARIRRTLHLACPVSLVLTAPTVAALAERLRGAEPSGHGPLSPDAHPDGPQGPAPLSPQQHGIYVEQVKDPTGTEYNLPLVVDLPEVPSAERLRTTLAALVARHDVLRTDITLDADGRPHQRVHAELPVALEEVDLPDDADPDAWTARWVRAFDPHRAPLWRVALLRRPGRARLVMDIHHLITDGCSLTLLATEWARQLGGAEPARPEVGYADYARWAAGPAGREHALAQGEFWRRTYATPVRPLDLPTDLPRPPVRRTEGAHLSFPLAAELSHAIRELARAEGVTPFHVLLAGYTAFLGRMSGSDDVTVGTPVSGRHLPGVERTQGMFVNTLCLRLNPRPELSFRAHLRAVADHAMAAADHQDFPFGELVAAAGERDYSRHPMFDTLFAVQDTGLHQVDFLGGRPRWTPEATGRTLFDLNLQIDDAPEGFTAHWAYSTHLFLPGTVELFRDELLALFDAAVTAPDTALHSMNVVAATTQAVPDFDFDF